MSLKKKLLILAIMAVLAYVAGYVKGRYLGTPIYEIRPSSQAVQI